MPSLPQTLRHRAHDINQAFRAGRAIAEWGKLAAWRRLWYTITDGPREEA